nr:MAG TPA: hypothetical protein [Caudoviricetes sp.]
MYYSTNFDKLCREKVIYFFYNINKRRKKYGKI